MQDGQLDNPHGTAVDAAGNLYVADVLNHRIQKFDPTGEFLLKWGLEPNPSLPHDVPYRMASTPGFAGSAMGTGEGEFKYPLDVAVGPAGLVYVVDRGNHRIQKFTPTGDFLASWGELGNEPGQFANPRGIAVAQDGTVFVTDSDNHRVQAFSASGTFLRSWGEPGEADGEFDTPYGITIDAQGSVYVADTYNHRIQKFNATGAHLRSWGMQGSWFGQFDQPTGLAVDPLGRIVVTDSANQRVQLFNGEGVFQDHWGGELGSGWGEFRFPDDVGVDALGNLYIVDGNNHRIQKLQGSGLLDAGQPDPVPAVGLSAYPNPMRTQSRIRLSIVGDGPLLSGAQRVTVRVFDASGRLVRDLHDGELPPGEHELAWDGRDDRGIAVKPGVYFGRTALDGATVGTVRMVKTR